jgi:hypothetical protein
VTSVRQVRANRANARASGPRTVAGKASAAHNARQHGLTISVLADRGLTAEVAALAREIAGEGASPEVLATAARIAEAQVDLVRVRRTRYELLSRALGNLSDHPPDVATNGVASARSISRISVSDPTSALVFSELLQSELKERVGITLSDVATKLSAINRYERRAFSRRKFAIRAFDEIRKRATTTT